MKRHWMLLIAMLALSVCATAQVGASSSATAGASVKPGQADANANSSQSAQVGGSQANANVAGSAQASHSEARREHEARAGEPAGSGAGSAGLNSGSSLQAELTKPVDAGKARPGDRVTAKVTEDVKSDGKVVVRKGSTLVGHVTEARARSKGSSDSRLGIVFDKAVLKSGQELSFNGALQALAPPVNAALSTAADESSNIGVAGPSGGGGGRRSGGGGLLGGATSAVGGATSTTAGVVGGATSTVAGTATGAVNGTVSGATGLAGGLTAQGRLTSASQGAFGLQGLTLNSAAAGNAQGSVVSSMSRTVRLESGTQMLVKVAGSAQ